MQIKMGTFKLHTHEKEAIVYKTGMLKRFRKWNGEDLLLTATARSVEVTQ
jgi:hypothetical protein